MQAGAQAANHVRRLAHVLDAAGEHDVRFAELDQLRAADGGLDAGPAQAVDRQRRHFLRHAGLERDVPRAVDRVAARLQHVAEHGVIDPVRLHAGLRRRRRASAMAPSSSADTSFSAPV